MIESPCQIPISDTNRTTKAISRQSDEFPSRLQKITDPPEHLYLHGELPQGPMVAIVGSRNADPSVCRFVYRLSGQLARHGIAIISGGALGIDTAAHQGALDADGSTVAVLGAGFDFLYPRENVDLFSRIAEHGCLMTEFHPRQPPTRWTFPKRNRIVAALSNGVLVAQAGQTSGALITARIARRMGIPLGAVPGTAADPGSRGNNNLIRQGAAVIETADDVLDLIESEAGLDQLQLPGLDREADDISTDERATLTPLEIKILDIMGQRPVHIDDIASGTGLGSSVTSATILSLEIAGLVEDQGGKNFIKVGLEGRKSSNYGQIASDR